MNLYIVRHGQSEGNINKAKYFEKLDCQIQLTEKGEVDAENAFNSIKNISNRLWLDKQGDSPMPQEPIHFNMYYSSYVRSQQTANIIRNEIIATPGYTTNQYIESPLCREREWGGLRDIVNMGNKTEDHFNFFYRPTNGESFADCFQRVAIFHQWLLSNSKYENNIVVAHGEFNKLYLMYLLGWSVEEFNKWKTPRNGEVYLIRDGVLSSITPLTPKYINGK